MIHLILDSCCDLNDEMRAELKPDRAALKVIVEGREDVDDGTVDIPDLIRRMKASRRAASSACPSVEEYAELMRPHDEVFVVTLSAKLSGSYNAAYAAQMLVLEESPEKKIHVFDSKAAVSGETLLALYLHEQIGRGLSFEEIVPLGEAKVKNTHTLFVLEDLGNMIKNGRLSKIPGLLASILSICPILSDDGNGEVKMLAKVRGIQNSLQRLCEITAEMIGKTRSSITLVLAHCNCPERAEKVREMLRTLCPKLGEIHMIATGALSTIYANEGGIVLAF